MLYLVIFTGTPMAPTIGVSVEHTYNDSFTFNLSWQAPFTWPGFPILSYTVAVTNYSSGQQIMISNISGTSTELESNDTGYYSNHSMVYTGRGSHCHNLSFSVEAENAIGNGKSVVLYTGQPLGMDHCE